VRARRDAMNRTSLCSAALAVCIAPVGAAEKGVPDSRPADVRARVQCGLASGRSFSFAAGRDRCWEPINGKTLVIASVSACAVRTTTGILEVTFKFSEIAAVDCPERETASFDQARSALAQLGPHEREFVAVAMGMR
jgi:hypothetical protein